MLFYFMLSALTDDDRQFVEKIYNEYGNYMYYTAYSILKNKHDAEDAVTDAMCKIIKYLSKFEKSANENACNMVTICIRSIIKNKAIDNYNKNKKRSKIFDDYYIKDKEDDEYVVRDIEDKSFVLEEKVIRQEECEIVRKALLELTQDMQDAVNLVYMSGYSCTEAADFLGISDVALRARLFKARKRLKEILEKELDVDVKK